MMKNGKDALVSDGGAIEEERGEREEGGEMHGPRVRHSVAEGYV